MDLRKQLEEIRKTDAASMLAMRTTWNPKEPILLHEVASQFQHLRKIVRAYFASEPGDWDLEFVSFQLVGMETELKVRTVCVLDRHKCSRCGRTFKSAQALGLHFHHGCKSLTEAA